MNEVTLPSRHSILNSIHGGLRPSTLHLSHGGSPQYSIVNGIYKIGERVPISALYYLDPHSIPYNMTRLAMWKVCDIGVIRYVF